MVAAEIQKEEKQRQDFRNLLFELAKSQIELEDRTKRSEIYQRLEKLYHAPKKEDEFRHFYSDIFLVLTQIQQGDKPGTMEILGQNLTQIRNGYKQCNKDSVGNQINISDSLRKLCDHVSLDIARIRHSESIGKDENLMGRIAALRLEVDGVRGNLEEAKEDVKEVKELREKVQDMQKEYIAILGIFASIVLAFITGIAFSSSVLENIHKSSIYRTIIIALIVGEVLINLMYGLFYYMDRIVHGNKVEKIGNDQGTKQKRITPLLVTNAILILFMLLTVAAWFFGVVEKRNEKMQVSEIVPTVTVDVETSEPTLVLPVQEEGTELSVEQVAPTE